MPAEQASLPASPSSRTTSRTDLRTTGAGARRWSGRLAALRTTLTERPVSLYAASVLRIGYGLLYLAFLLREFPHRHEIWGPGSPWTPALAAQLFEQTGWSSILLLSDSRVYFEFCYGLALLTSALFVLGQAVHPALARGAAPP